MHKLARKLGALFTMLALVLTTVAPVSPAFAAGNTGSLKVTSTSAEFAGKTVMAYKMFSATNPVVGADGTTATYSLESSWKNFFQDKVENGSSMTDDELSQAAYDYVKNLSTSSNPTIEAFAKDASDYALNVGNSVYSVSAVAGTEAVGGKYTATFSGLAFGYYLVKPNGTTDAARGTNAHLVNVVNTAGDTLELKSKYPTVEKKVENGGQQQNHNSANIGDTVKFTLTSAVPDTTDYSTYTFKIKDKLSKGLTFDENSVQVKVADAALTKDTDYKVNKIINDNGTTSVVIDFLTIKNQVAGSAITVTYSATLNEDAGSGSDTQGKNEATVEYSNDPSTDGTGVSKPSITHTYDFDFDLKKVGEDGATALADAEFQLLGTDGNAVTLISDGAAGYRPVKTGETGGNTSVTTPETGIIKFTGLKEGEYKLVELKAPAGYNKLSASVDVVISATYNEDGTLSDYTVTANGDTNTTVTVVNKKGTLLPSTGGMGTVIFTVAGAAVVIAGVAWTIARRRAQN